MLVVVEIENNLLIVAEIENNLWPKLVSKVKIKSKTFELSIL